MSLSYGKGVFVSGRYAYVADSSALRVIDIARLANPQRVTQASDIEGYGAMAVSGNHAYLAGRTRNQSGILLEGLKVLDISDSYNVRQVSYWPSNSSAGAILDIDVIADRAYLALGRSGFRVLNISNPLQPQLLGWYSTNGVDIRKVYVSGNSAYLADAGAVDSFGQSTGGALVILDLTTAANPQAVTRYPIPRVGPRERAAYDVSASGDYVYLADTDGEIHVLNLTDPVTPKRMTTIPARADRSLVNVVGTYLYIADWYGGLAVANISNPGNPEIIGSFTEGAHFPNVWGVTDLVISEKYAYLSGSFGLSIIDVSDPARPRRVGGNSAVAATGLSVTDKNVILASSDGLTILDLFRPRADFSPFVRSESSKIYFEIQGPSGVTGRIQRSRDLRNWEDWQPFTLGERPLEVSDDETGSAGLRFYRLVTP